MRRYVVAFLVATALMATQASAQSAVRPGSSSSSPNRGAKLDVRIPQLIAYQGKLTDSTGRPVDDGSYVMIFSLSADSTGSSFWHETQAVVTTGGLFNVLLGSKVPLAADSIPRSGCYLGIRVLPATEEFRRQRIVSVPFAFQANNSDLLQGRDSAALDSVYVSHADSGAVTSALIADGTITRADVAPGFTAPYADTADYARLASDSARVAANAHMIQGKDTAALWNAKSLQGKDTTALWNAKTLEGKDTTGFVRAGQPGSISSGMIVANTIVRGNVATSFKAPYSDTADYASAAPASDSAGVAGNSHRLQGKDTTALWNAKTLQGKDTVQLNASYVNEGQTNSVTSPMICDTAVNTANIKDSAVTAPKIAAEAVTASKIAAGAVDSTKLADGSVTGADIKDGTITSADIAKSGVTAGTYGDGYHVPRITVDSAGRLTAALDSTILGAAPTGPAGGDLNGNYPNPTIAADKVTSAKILDGSILRSDVVASFKAPYADTADYAVSAPSSDSARIAGNSHLLQGKDTAALWNSKTLQGKDTSGFVRTNQSNSVTSAMVVNGTVVRADVATNFKAPYSDTADYAISAPTSDSSRVSGNSHLLLGKDTTALWNAKTLQGKDTIALWNAKTLQGKDTTALWNAKFLQGKDTAGFVRTNQANSVTSAMIVNGTVVRADVVTGFKAPYADTADYAVSAPASDSARVAGNSYLLQTKDTTALWNAKTLQGKDTAALWNAKTLQGRDTSGFVRTGQANSITTGMIVNGEVQTSDIADANVTAAKIAANAVDSTKIADGAVTSADIRDGTITSADIAKSGVTAGTYGDGYHVARITVDSAGRLTAAVDSTIIGAAPTGPAGGDLTGNYPNPTIAADKVTSTKILDGTIAAADLGQMGATSNQVMKWSGSAWEPRSDSGTVMGVSQGTGIVCTPNPITGSGTVALDQSYGDGRYVNEAQANSITSGMIVANTIVRSNVASNFKAPYSDTADYAKTAPAVDSARVAGNSYQLQGKDTTALWNAKTLEGKDTSGFVRTNQANSITSTMVVNGTILRADVASSFKAPYADTADYAVSAPASDSARVAGNSHLLLGKDTTALWNAKSLQGKDTAALWNAKTLQGKDTTGFVRAGQVGSITSAMIADNTIVRTDVVTGFKAPYSDTADYAKAAPASDSARVAGNSHLLQGRDTIALWNAKTLQGKDTTALSNAKTLQGKDTSGFVRSGQVDAVTSAMIVNGTIVRNDVAATFKAPYTDTADYAKAAPAVDSARVSGNSHKLEGKDTTALWNAKTLQGRDTTGFVRTNQVNSITTGMITNGEVQTVDIADANVSAAKIATGAVDSTKIADGSVTSTDIKDGTITSADIAKSGVTAGTYGDGYHVARITVDSAGRLTAAVDSTILGAAPTGPAGGDLNGNYPNPTIASNAVTSSKILNGTITRADVSSGFKAPYSDTADYAKAAPASDSARVAGNSYRLEGKDTTALWNAKTLQGKDTTVLWNAKTLQGKDTAALWNAKTLQGRDTAALWNAKTLQGKDTTGFVRPGQIDAVTSVMIVNGTVVRADVATSFKAPYSDTADYAKAAPAVDSARVAGNSYQLQGKDTAALWNAKTLQGRDTTAFDARYVNEGQTAGGDLTGSYPSPSLASVGSAGSYTLASVTVDAKGRVTAASNGNAVQSVAGSWPIQSSGGWNPSIALVTSMGGDLSGSYPNPAIAADKVTSGKILDGTIVRADVAAGFKSPYSDTADYARAAPAVDSSRVAGNAHLLQGKDTVDMWNAKALQGKDTAALWNAKTLQGKDTSGFVRAGQAGSISTAMIVANTIVRGNVATTFKAPYADTADYAKAAPAVDSARVAGNSYLLQGKDTSALGNAKTLQGRDTTALWNAKTLQGKDTTGFVRANQLNSISGAMITDGTIARADVAASFKAPYSDTADYAISAPASDSARVAGNSHLLQGKDTSALGNAKTLQGKDTTGFVRPGQPDVVTSAMIVNGTIARADVAASFKAPFADTADYAVSAPSSDSARIAGNSHLLQGRDTAALWNAKMIQGKDTTALWNAKTLQGRDTTGFVLSGQVDAVTSAMIVNGTIARNDVVNTFKAPYSDTADYAISTRASDSARVSGYSHSLEGKDTAALWNAKTLQGKDTTGFVRTGQVDAVTSAMIANGTIVSGDAAPNFKAPYADTADFAISAPAIDSARVAGSSHLLEGKDTTALWNAKTLQGKDTISFVRTGQADAVTGPMVVDGTIGRADVASSFKAPYADTADYAASAPASESALVAGNSHQLQGKDTAALWNAKTLQGKDTNALDTRYVNEGQAAGGDLSGSYPNPAIALNAVTSAKVLDGALTRADVAGGFKAPYADTADYAFAAPASDSATVAGNSHLLQGKDTLALGNAKTLQGKDTTGFVRTGQSDAVTSAMIVPNTIVRADVAATFKAPYADTADYANSAPAADSARVAGNAHLLLGKDTTALWNAKTLQGKDTAALWNAKTLQGKDTAALWNAKTLQGRDTTALWNAKMLQGKDTTGFVRSGQANSIASGMITANNVTLSKIERGAGSDSGMAIVSLGSGQNPVWSYPAAVGNTSPTTMQALRFGTVSVNFPNTGSRSFAETTATVTGAATGDLVFLTSSTSFNAEFILCATCQVTSANTIRARAYNASNTAIDPASDNMHYVLIKP